MSANINYELIRMLMDFQHYEFIFAEYERLINNQNTELEECHNAIASLQEMIIRQRRQIEILHAYIDHLLGQQNV